MRQFFKTGLLLVCLGAAPYFAQSKELMARDIIDTKVEFLTKVAGKRISVPTEKTWLIAKANGQIDGRFRGIKIRGNWNWNNGYWCRSARIGILPIPRECQQISLADEMLILQRFKGTGSSHTYQIN